MKKIKMISPRQWIVIIAALQLVTTTAYLLYAEIGKGKSDALLCLLLSVTLFWCGSIFQEIFEKIK